MSVPARVASVLKTQLDVEDAQIIPTARLRGDLNASSIDIVEIIAAFENEFNITIPDDAAQAIRTVGDAIDYLSKPTT